MLHKIKKFFKHVNKKALIGVLLAIILGILAIVLGLNVTKNKVDNNTSVDDNNEGKEETKEEKPKISIVNPESKSRPYAVMINNISVARPLQSGLQDAYIIYEMIVEGGITRYLALFMDQTTDRIGSIRSARHYYLDYALENDAIYVHCGYSPQAQSDFSTLGIDRIEVGDNTGFRDRTLNVSSEHTLFTSISKLGNGLGNKRTERNKDLLLNYTTDIVDLSNMENSTKADKVSIKYSNGTTSSYKYDSEHQYYLRYVNNKEHSDYVTKEQYHFKNIITYQVDNITIAGDAKGRQDIANVGEGTGYYITNGYAVKIKWSKESRSAQTKYTYMDGKEIDVSDGNTFIQIQPKGQDLIIE